MPGESCTGNALVTGGTDGIGRQIAIGLARAGYRLILAGRDPDKGAQAVREVAETTGNREVEFIAADIGLARGARRLADEVAGRWTGLHRLVHSAGMVRGRYTVTREGIESNFAVNYLGRFALTTHLLPLLQSAGQPAHAARILMIGGAAQGGRIHFDDINLTARFNTIRAVLQFCAANDIFTVELARRLATGKNPCVTVACLKIGVVKTRIRREFPLWMKWLVPLVFDPLLGQSPQEAAGAALRLLLGGEFEGVSGARFLKIRKLKPVGPSPRTDDPDLGRRLWELSERLANCVAPGPAASAR